MHLTKKLSHSLRSLGRIHAGRLRHYAPHACAPYLKVSSHMKMETAVEIDEDKIDEAALALFYLSLIHISEPTRPY